MIARSRSGPHNQTSFAQAAQRRSFMPVGLPPSPQPDSVIDDHDYTESQSLSSAAFLYLVYLRLALLSSSRSWSPCFPHSAERAYVRWQVPKASAVRGRGSTVTHRRWTPGSDGWDIEPALVGPEHRWGSRCVKDGCSRLTHRSRKH